MEAYYCMIYASGASRASPPGAPSILLGRATRAGAACPKIVHLPFAQSASKVDPARSIEVHDGPHFDRAVARGRDPRRDLDRRVEVARLDQALVLIDEHQVLHGRRPPCLEVERAGAGSALRPAGRSCGAGRSNLAPS